MEKSHSRTLIVGVFAIALLAGLFAGWYFFSQRAGDQSQQAAAASARPSVSLARIYGSPRYLTDFAFEDDLGQPFGRDQISGEWHLIFFGFTHCPDICPTTMAQLAAVTRLLRDAGKPVPQVLFISVDPERDAGEVMGQYARNFDPGFRAATGPHAQLGALTLQMGAPYINHQPPADAHAHHRDPDAVQVDHSAAVFMTDPQARLVAAFPPPLTVAEMAADIERIIDAL